jgi:cyclophilin family peptidyl-prolyl cis-trans isomerase/HEAT repeat protein
MNRIARPLLTGMAVLVAACATAPPAAPPPPMEPPSFSYEQKLGWILYLEDARTLRDAEPVPWPALPAPRQGLGPGVLPPPVVPDLTELTRDPDPRLRRRAAIAIGRVGSRDGVNALLAALSDPDPAVRQVAAFGLGLLGDPRGVAPLTAALDDPDWRVRGRAADALGRIGEVAAADAVGRLAIAAADAGALTGLAPDEMGYPFAPGADAYRLALSALVRLKAFDQLAAAVLDASGLPRTRWWPVAYALQRIENPRALSPLVALATGDGVEARAFAARGLGALKDARGVDALLWLADPRNQPPRVVAQAVRSLGQIGDARAVPALIALARQPALDDNVRLEVVTALGTLRPTAATTVLVDLITDRWPVMRAAAMRSLAQLDPETLLVVLSALDADPSWQVRADLATTLGTLGAQRTLPLLGLLWKDADARVHPAALNALAAVDAPDLRDRLREAFTREDEIVRAAAATILGRVRPAGGEAELLAAWQQSKTDAAIDARAAALEALAAYGPETAREPLAEALADRDWAVRVKAMDLLRKADPAVEASRARPAPTLAPRDTYGAAGLVAPRYSPQAYIETASGTIQIELDVIDAPLTARNFVTLARKGYFNGLTFHRVVPNFVIQGGDPRGDGEGGPGYTIRDELSDLPYLRGSVGMALSWADTGGSQFFITHGPQPHLDGRYAVFGRVVAGMETVDRIRRGDVIERVRVWDGVEMR